jgi:hypothetical protein
MKSSIAIIIFSLSSLSILNSQAQSKESIDTRVQTLFQDNCSKCHGGELPPQKRKGDQKQMKLDSNTTWRSLDNLGVLNDIISRVTTTNEDDRMPQDSAPLSTEEISLLDNWIKNGGAAGEAPRVVSAADIIKRDDLFDAVLADLIKAPTEDRQYYRYLTLHNLRNAGESRENIRIYRAAVSETLNSLSIQTNIVAPIAFGPDNILMRVDLRDYGWSDSKWNLLANSYPYDIQPVALTAAERDVKIDTRCDLPIMRADWFVFAATQYPFYAELLSPDSSTDSGLPDTDKDLESELGIDVLSDIQNGRIKRAAFKYSGVSISNRLIERHAHGTGGYYWKSYDFKDGNNEGDLIVNPLGPKSTGCNQAFRHDGGEIIWSLPNGLQAYLLANASGKVLTRGPQGIVQDADGPQNSVIDGISCIRCHVSGMRFPDGGINDVIRTENEARHGLSGVDQTNFDVLYSVSPDNLFSQIKSDSESFKSAARQTGLIDSDFEPENSPMDQLYSRFKRPITRESLASEFDMDQADTEKQLKKYENAGNAQMDSIINSLNRDGIKRQDFITDYAFLVSVFGPGNARSFNPVEFEEFKETTRPGDATNAPVDVEFAPIGFTNSLGMIFVSVPGTNTLFCVWDTRVQDYQAMMSDLVQAWAKANFAQGPTEPAVMVTWDDARRFCVWLTEKEHRTGLLPQNAYYRLPSCQEWFLAVGTNTYPWGEQWPPPIDAGNYSANVAVDTFDNTSPVGNFHSNQFGLFDMGGNVDQWCQDEYDNNNDFEIAGSSFIEGDINDPTSLKSSNLHFANRTTTQSNIGFRIVLVRFAP